MRQEISEKTKFPYTETLTQIFNDFYEHIGNNQAENKAFLPYYYLQSDLWQIQWETGVSQKCPFSSTGVKKEIKFVSFKPELYNLLKDQSAHELIKG